MYFKNKMLHRSIAAGSLFAIALLTGCQSQPISWLGAQHSAGPTDRQISLAQTPMAKAKRDEVAQKQMMSGVAASDPRAMMPPQAAAMAMPTNPGNGVMLAGANMPIDGTDPAQSAHYRGRAASRQIAQAQYAPIGQSRGSENIPRVPMGSGPVSYEGEHPVSVHGPSYSTASHARPHGHAHASGHCPACSSGPYQPYYPNLSGSCGDANCSGGCGVMIQEGYAVPRSSDPQEYIFDGGDHDPQVRLRSDLSQVGLDPEDTVIQYQTVDGKTNVESGCRVAIYAPRFASVRKRQSTIQQDIAMRPQSAIRPDGPGVVRDQLPQARVSKPVKPLNSDNVRIVEAFRDRNRPLPAELVLPMVTVSEAFKPYEDLSLIRNGDIKATDLAKLARSTAAARAWTNVDELHVIVDGQQATDVTGSKRAAEISLYEYKGARIRLCKVASEQMANPGDIISFTIRFDNVGEQPLSSLVITDSLAPRLEYVDQSQQASVPAEFSLTPNSAGSAVLRWELENGLKPGEGGLVRFDCKVR